MSKQVAPVNSLWLFHGLRDTVKPKGLAGAAFAAPVISQGAACRINTLATYAFYVTLVLTLWLRHVRK